MTGPGDAVSRRLDATVTDLLHHCASRHPERLFVECGEARRTYREMCASAEELASGLSAIGVRPGDRVACLLPNRIEAVELFFGCARLGAVQVPLNTYLKGEFLCYQVDDCAAETIVVDSAGLAVLMPLLPRLPQLRRIITVDDRIELPEGSVSTISYSDLPCRRAGTTTAPKPGPDDLAAIFYTSGTTGMPKGCMMRHGYLVHSGEVFAGALTGGLHDDDICFCVMPLFHLTGLASAILAPLTKCLSAVVEPTFSASGFFDRIIETRATFTMGIGAMAHALLATAPTPADRAHELRLASFAPLSAPMRQAFADRFGVQVGTLGYGQTECFPVTVDVAPPAGDDTAASHPPRPTPGRPVPWLDVRILDDRDVEVARGDVGEIVVRPATPNTMFSGYWNKPDATIRAFRDLWHHTGDLGRMDGAGLITFVDRKKDAIRRRGENISSVEVELAIAQHPAVGDVAVHAVPSPLGEDDVKAWIVPAAGEDPTPEALFAHFADALPYFAIPRYVQITDALPRNHSGKVLKSDLKEQPPLPTGSGWDFEALGYRIDREHRRSRP